ncbi:MAG TPA: hypothetical protein VLG09_02785 [Candidatus Saccharimonadales bacterium]|nr:hypothetical protein [Candidatus Saccharimonadales bacterium]
MCHFSWLELKNLFQTFGLQDEFEIEQEIEKFLALIEEAPDCDVN